MEDNYLLSVSDGASKLFWLFSSAISSSLAASSSGVGKAVETAGVTPHCLIGAAIAYRNSCARRKER